MIPLLLTLLAVDGIVINRTSGKPQPGATVTMFRISQAGPESLESVKADAQGRFAINQPVQGPTLIQAAYGGVTYNKMIPPGRPSTGLEVDVYESSPQPGEARVTQHFVLFEPDGANMAVTESYVWENNGKTAFADPDRGTLRISVPAAAFASLQVNATAPASVPVRQAAQKTAEKDVYKVDFPIKPGESNVQLNYTVPFTGGAYAGRVFVKTGMSSLIAPQGVTLKGTGLEDRGEEPRTKAHVWQLRAQAYSITLEGTGRLRTPSDQQQPETSAGPQIQEIPANIYKSLPWVLGLAFGILAAGFILLYRQKARP